MPVPARQKKKELTRTLAGFKGESFRKMVSTIFSSGGHLMLSREVIGLKDSGRKDRTSS